MVERLIKPLKSQSFFLFGARGTGKSSFLKVYFRKDKVFWIDLLDDLILEKYQISSQTLLHEIEALKLKKKIKWVVIDEVQKAPKLLNVVHQVIESAAGIKFALTGSSSRRLKQKGVNLLAGRAFVENLYPLTFLEYGRDFNLNEALTWGTLPTILHCKTKRQKEEYLRSYTLTYIKSEVQEEQWVRNIEPFRKFLPVAAQMNGQPLNFSKIARDVGSTSITVQSYFEILEDTLLGFMLPGFNRSVRKQQREAAKFFFFDLGVKRSLARALTLPVTPGTYEYGKSFEHFIIVEIYRLNSYLRKDFEMSYLLTKDGLEIDLILDRPGKNLALIEIKSTDKVTGDHVKHLRQIKKSLPDAECFVLSQDSVAKQIDGISCLFWAEGIRLLLK